MTYRLDVDLASDDPVRLRFGEDAWVLVRFEDHVLGEVAVEESDLMCDQPLHDFLMRTFAAEVLWAVRSEATASPLSDDATLEELSIVVEAGGHPQTLVDACLGALNSLDPGPVEVQLSGYVGGDGPVSDARLLEQRNDLLRVARGSHMVFLQPGCILHPGFVARATRPFSLPQLGAVIPLITPHELETQGQVVFDRLFLPRRRYERRLWSSASETGFDPVAIHPGVVGGLVYRRRALEEVGGFPTNGGITVRQSEYQTLERLVSGGWILQSEPDAEIRHTHPDSRRAAFEWLTNFASDRAEHRRHAPREARPSGADVAVKNLRRVVRGDLDLQRRLTVAGASARALIASSVRGAR